MNTKNFIFLIILVVIAVMVTFISTVMLTKYDFYITDLFVEDTTSAPDSIFIEPTLEIPKAKIKEFEAEVERRKELDKQKDSLLKLIATIRRKDTSLINELDSYKDSLMPAKERHIDSVKKFTNNLQDSINNLFEEIRQSQNEIDLAEEKIKEQKEYIESGIDSSTMANYTNFAKIYNNTNPQKVAEQLERLPEKDAAVILKPNE